MPAPIASRYQAITRHVIDIPWGPLPLAPEEDVLILGTGLTNLGLDVDEKNRVLDATGATQADLFAMGALTRGRWWEITAIPEISRRATELAGHLRAYLGTQDSGMRVNARSVE